MSKIAEIYIPLADQFKKYLEFRGITEYISVGQTNKSMYASIDTHKTEEEVRKYFTNVFSTSMSDAGNSFIVNLHITDLNNPAKCGDFRFFNPDNLIPHEFDGTWDAKEHPLVKSLIERFTNYCWRLGFTPEEVKIDTTALYVRSNTRNLFYDVKKGFTEWNTDEEGRLWLRLAYTDVHNELITGHNRNTKNWFEGYKVPQFHSGRK